MACRHPLPAAHRGVSPCARRKSAGAGVVSVTAMRVTVMIVDDEPLARQALRRFIAEERRLSVVGEAADGADAVAKLEALRPAVVFLDVEMPELSGIRVLDALTYSPLVVFTTAYESYALPAIEHEAVDYLLKPFTRQRFRVALDRVLRRVADRAAVLAPEAAAPVPAPDLPWMERIFVQRRGAAVPVRMRDVLYIEGNDDYVTVRTVDETHLASLTLTELERRLDPTRFRRVHRRLIVNLEHVEQLRPIDERRIALRLTGGVEVTASRSGSRALRDLIV